MSAPVVSTPPAGAVPGGTVQVVVGGEVITLPPMTFGRLKRAWPLIERGSQPLDRLTRTDLALELIAVASGEAGDPAAAATRLAERLLATEMDGALACVRDILVAAGVVPPETQAGDMPGDPRPGEAAATGSPASASTI